MSLREDMLKLLCAMPVWTPGADLCLADMTLNHWGFRSAAPGANTHALGAGWNLQ